jgi:cyclophilin family peptidyl-prolyl cis-trans isomerase
MLTNMNMKMKRETSSLRIVVPVLVLLSCLSLCLPGGCSPPITTRHADQAVTSKPSGDNPQKTSTVNPTMEKQVAQKTGNPVVVIETSMGIIEAELWADKAPLTVENFLRYVDEGFYDGLIFHRVIDGFMIQGGGMTADLKSKATHEQIKNEAKAELKNLRGTLAMARTNDVNSATAQFFINLADNDFLNHTGEGPREFGYCAFGKVTAGMDVVAKIGKVKTGTRGHYDDVPVAPVEIKSVRRK